MAGIPLDFTESTDGPGLIAQSETEIWRIECKGAGRGRSQTQRNHFDRALARVVSYFELGAGKKAALGLALPRTSGYMHELDRRVRAPLRERLDLWILVFDASRTVVDPVAPGDSIKAT